MAHVRRVAAAALVAALAVGVAACGDDDDSAGPDPTSTTLATGGIHVKAPSGWQKVPLPQLGFGLAVPPKWEALVLSDSGLASLATANPAVPGFAVSAHAAAGAGSIFYAAGVDAQGRVTDLKVRADPRTGVKDLAGLERYARGLARYGKVANPVIQAVKGTKQPTVSIRFHGEAERADPKDANKPAVKVPVEGTEFLVLSPRHVVYSLIVTDEQPAGHDAFARQLFDTVTFPTRN